VNRLRQRPGIADPAADAAGSPIVLVRAPRGTCRAGEKFARVFDDSYGSPYEARTVWGRTIEEAILLPRNGRRVVPRTVTAKELAQRPAP
jgi:hypothetical protein